MYLRSFTAALVSTLVFSTSAAAFTPDRAYFFQQCDSIPGFSQRSGSTTVTVGPSVRLRGSARETINSFFDEWEAIDGQDQRHLAFIIATTYRETMGRMQSIREAPQCGEDEACRERTIGRSYAQPHENGQRYYGRGFVQLTGHRNYQRATATFGVDFVNNPDLALDPIHARQILFRGMSEGWFSAESDGTRRTLAFYFNDEREDWLNARKIVNPGSRRREVTAALGQHFNSCLRPLASAP